MDRLTKMEIDAHFRECANIQTVKCTQTQRYSSTHCKILVGLEIPLNSKRNLNDLEKNTIEKQLVVRLLN